MAVVNSAKSKRKDARVAEFRVVFGATSRKFLVLRRIQRAQRGDGERPDRQQAEPRCARRSARNSQKRARGWRHGAAAAAAAPRNRPAPRLRGRRARQSGTAARRPRRFPAPARLPPRRRAARVSRNGAPRSSRPNSALVRLPTTRNGNPSAAENSRMKVSASTPRMAPGSMSLRSGAPRAPRRAFQ